MIRTRRFALAVGTSVAAIALCAPIALASITASPAMQAYERSVAAKQLDPSTFRNAFDRTPRLDAFDRAVALGRLDLSTFRNTFERAAPVAAVDETLSSVDTGSGLEWAQLGAGVAIGALFACCVMLALHAVRGRPAARA